jgi:aspartate/methionine/tyrosine aminotransferase
MPGKTKFGVLRKIMKNKIVTCVRNIVPSVIREMSLKAAAYKDVISLGIGEPDFDTPGEICQGALGDALAGHTHYTPFVVTPT